MYHFLTVKLSFNVREGNTLFVLFVYVDATRQSSKTNVFFSPALGVFQDIHKLIFLQVILIFVKAFCNGLVILPKTMISFGPYGNNAINLLL